MDELIKLVGHATGPAAGLLASIGFGLYAMERKERREDAMRNQEMTRVTLQCQQRMEDALRRSEEALTRLRETLAEDRPRRSNR